MIDYCPNTWNLAAQLVNTPIDVEVEGRCYQVVFDLGSYFNGRPALFLVNTDDGAPFGTLTCNIPEVPLEDKEIIVKTWSENGPLSEACRYSGLFEDTEKRIQTGFVSAEIWKIKEKKEA